MQQKANAASRPDTAMRCRAAKIPLEGANLM
jgi:hypothetical protein